MYVTTSHLNDGECHSNEYKHNVLTSEKYPDTDIIWVLISCQTKIEHTMLKSSMQLIIYFPTFYMLVHFTVVLILDIRISYF